MVTAAPNGNEARTADVTAARSPSSHVRYTDAIATPTAAAMFSRSSPLTRSPGPVMSGPSAALRLWCAAACRVPLRPSPVASALGAAAYLAGGERWPLMAWCAWCPASARECLGHSSPPGYGLRRSGLKPGNVPVTATCLPSGHGDDL